MSQRCISFGSECKKKESHENAISVTWLLLVITITLIHFSSLTNCKLLSSSNPISLLSPRYIRYRDTNKLPAHLFIKCSWLDDESRPPQILSSCNVKPTFSHLATSQTETPRYLHYSSWLGNARLVFQVILKTNHWQPDQLVVVKTSPPFWLISVKRSTSPTMDVAFYSALWQINNSRRFSFYRTCTRISQVTEGGREK